MVNKLTLRSLRGSVAHSVNYLGVTKENGASLGQMDLMVNEVVLRYLRTFESCTPNKS